MKPSNDPNFVTNFTLGAFTVIESMRKGDPRLQELKTVLVAISMQCKGI